MPSSVAASYCTFLGYSLVSVNEESDESNLDNDLDDDNDGVIDVGNKNVQ